MSISDNSAVRAGDKTPKEINDQNQKFWEVVERQVKRWPDFINPAVTRIECHALVQGLRSAGSFEYQVIKLAQQHRLGVKLTPREQKIWRVIQQGVRGETYCRELGHQHLKPPKPWKDDGCPSTYFEAYREGEPWRKRIQDEKCRIQTKAELAELVDRMKSHR